MPPHLFQPVQFHIPPEQRVAVSAQPSRQALRVYGVREQAGLLGKDRRVQRAQLLAGLHTDLAHEPGPGRTVGLQRFRLPPRLVKRDHQLAPEPLPQRICGHQRLQLADQGRRMAEGELGVETVGYRGQPQLRKLIAFCHRELGVTQILVRIPSPQLQRTPEPGKRELGCAGQQRRPRLPDKLFEKCRVQGRRVDAQAVPRRHRDQNPPPRWRTVQLQQSTQPGNVASQRFLRRRRRGRSPHPVHQARHRDSPVTLGQQQAKECPLPRASQRQRLTVPADLQRPQYPEPQAGRGTADDLASRLTRWSRQPASTLAGHVGYPLRHRSPARPARRRRLVVRDCCVDEVRCLRGRPDMIKRCVGVPPVHRVQPPSSRDSSPRQK